MKKTYKVSAVIADITEWNNEYQDWSGKQFSTDFYGNGSITTEKLTRLQLRDCITELLYLDDDFLTEAELFCSGNTLSVAITEDGNGEPDPAGNYLVDYTFIVTEVSEVDLQEEFLR